MKIFLATGSREYLMLLLLSGVKQILVSFEYPEPYKCKKLLHQNGIKLMVDSGAYSAWAKGSKIDVDEYIKFIIDNKDVIDPGRIVNLDIILGGREGLVADAITRGETTSQNMWLDTVSKPAHQVHNSSKEQFEEACKKGFENYYYMLEKLTPVFGSELKIIHVFHQGDNFKWLSKMLKECQRIGISPNNDESDSSKNDWLMECFDIIKKENPNIETHAFGVTSKRLLEKFPYTTADSSSWAMSSSFGVILTPFGRFIVSEESKHKPGHIDFFPLQVRQKLEEYLATFGFSFDHVKKKYKYRAIVNVFYFLQMEKEINETGHSFDHFNRQTSLFQRPTQEEIDEAKERILQNNIL